MSATMRLNDPRYLIGHWPLNGHAQDVSKHGYDGTLVNAPTYATSPFSGHACMNFNGSTQSVTVGNIAQLNGATKLTVSLWMSQDVVASAQDRVFERVSGLNGFLLHTGVSQFAVYAMAGSATSLLFNYPASLVNTMWAHVCAVYDGTQAVAANRVSVYCDAVPLATTGGVGTIPTSIGDCGSAIAVISGNTSDYGFGGKLYQCRLYNIALTGSEIAALYRLDRR